MFTSMWKDEISCGRRTIQGVMHKVWSGRLLRVDSRGNNWVQNRVEAEDNVERRSIDVRA